MQTGERALAIAFLNQVLIDFIAGCEMYTEARKSIETKGKLPGSYYTVIGDFDKSLALLVPKSRSMRDYLIFWAELAGSDGEAMMQKFQTIMKGEGKLNGKSYYEHIRDKWICEAYEYNSTGVSYIEAMNKYKKLKNKEAKYMDYKNKAENYIKSLEKRIQAVEERKTGYKEAMSLPRVLDKEALKEKIKDCDLLINIYKTKSKGNRNVVFKSSAKEKEELEN